MKTIVSTLLIYLFCNVISAAGSHDFVITNEGDETIYAAAGSTYKSLVESKFFCVGWFKIEPGRSNTIYGVSHQGNIYLAFAKMGDNGVMESIGVWSEEGYYKEPEGFNIPVTADNFRYNVDYQEDKFQTKKLNNGFVRIPFTVRFDVRNTLGSNDEYTTYFTVNSSLEHPVFSEIPDGAESTKKPFFNKMDEVRKEMAKEKQLRLKEQEENRKRVIAKHSEMVNPKYLNSRTDITNRNSACAKRFTYVVDAVKVLDKKTTYANSVYYDYKVELEDNLYKSIPSKTFTVIVEVPFDEKDSPTSDDKLFEKLKNGQLESVKIIISTCEDKLKYGKTGVYRVRLYKP